MPPARANLTYIVREKAYQPLPAGFSSATVEWQLAHRRMGCLPMFLKRGWRSSRKANSIRKAFLKFIARLRDSRL